MRRRGGKEREDEKGNSRRRKEREADVDTLLVSDVF